MIHVRQDLSLITPSRLGPFLGEARRMIGLSLVDLVGAIDGLLTQHELRLLESGRLCPTDEQVRALAVVLHLPLEKVVPGRVRLIVDVAQGQMVTSGTVVTFVPQAEPDDVLLNYLACIATCRRTRPGTYVAPRLDDLEVLGVALDETSMWVRQRLAVLSREERDRIRVRARSVTQRSMLPSLGLFVAYTSVGALLLVDAEANLH